MRLSPQHGLLLRAPNGEALIRARHVVENALIELDVRSGKKSQAVAAESDGLCPSALPAEDFSVLDVCGGEDIGPGPLFDASSQKAGCTE